MSCFFSHAGRTAIPALLSVALAAAACNKDGEITLPDSKPRITLDSETGVYAAKIGRAVTITPTVENEGEAAYSWTIDDEVVSTARVFEYVFNEEGRVYVTLRVENRAGYDEKEGEYEVTFRVTDTDESPAAPLSRHITRASSKRITEKTLRVTCYERESERVITTTGQPASNRVLEFLPAPGQFVNETGMAGYTGQKSFEEARLYAENRLKKGEFVSLGNFGGYVILAFDHSVENKGKYDFSIPGNQFEGSNEPGVVWVMQDVNGNGKPDDEWYELRGSETGGEWTVQEYAVTYYRPAGPRQGVKWTDNLGRSGQVAYLGQFHAQDYYYPLWLEEESHTYYGTGLRQNTTQTPGGDWSNNSFEWGYVDNAGSDNLESSSKTGKTWFKISNAMTPDGQPAGLRYIDFIKVQSAINGSAGGLGELSTEVAGMAVDENLDR